MKIKFSSIHYHTHYITLLLLLIIGLAGCAAETGSLEFRANGEDFVRQGFVSKDGWLISFDTVEVTLSEIKAYQTDGQFDVSAGGEPEGTSVALSESQTIDLAAGDAEAAPILVGTAEAEVGHYDAVRWDMINDENGDTMRLVGSAEKDGETIDFTLTVKETYSYACGEFIGGSERKGFVDPDSTDEVEMTFHFDHVFGDGDAPADDGLNVGALGFEPIAELAAGGVLMMSSADLSNSLSAEDYATLLDTLATLGHVGEGHCYEANNGYTDKE